MTQPLRTNFSAKNKKSFKEKFTRKNCQFTLFPLENSLSRPSRTKRVFEPSFLTSDEQWRYYTDG